MANKLGNKLPIEKAKELLQKVEAFREKLETKSELGPLRSEIEETVRSVVPWLPAYEKMRVDLENLKLVLWALKRAGLTALGNAATELPTLIDAATAACNAIGDPPSLAQVIEAEDRVEELLYVIEEAARGTFGADPHVKKNADAARRGWVEKRSALARLKERLLNKILG